MASVRPMTAIDLFNFNTCNLDHLTETYNTTFYLEYLSKWPHLCRVIEGHNGQIEGYILGKTEASPYTAPVEPFHPKTNPNPNYLPWHGHVTALTISPSARRLGYATLLTAALEQQCDAHNAWFVDLFVRAENVVAQELYKKMGYSVYRRVVSYYQDDEDAFDMRKPLSRDKDRDTVREGGEDFHVDPNEVW
ncbi:n-acetyltransferas-like protein [Venturia nashicola]|uniref:N-acetyltransferas-like protein n=1 Tax=Venturia nashicola TaxID=86259 RepID=A0A4Z1NMV5_9PEZI|nr:n-acetyltransferas-like protein [Venturia nashicola]TLD26086.1 n-acetyltransferas-like protein [Venturia nashicola]